MSVMHLPWPLAILTGLLAGAAIGLVNGLVITKCLIPPLIVTLGMQYIIRGLINVITKGKPYTGFPKAFNLLGTGQWFGLAYSVYLSLLIVLISVFVLRYTGREIGRASCRERV